MQKIRNFLPFSPAKEGPLSDLHRVKLIETIAQTITPTPLLERMSKALEPAKTSIQPLLQPVKPASITITVNLGPITVAQGTQEETKTLAMYLEKEIRKVLDKINKEKFRREY